MEDKTKAGEVFIRYSDHRNDWKVDTIRYCVVKYTYATTEEDASKYIKNCKDPVERYSLDSKVVSAKYFVVIKPKESTRIKRGIVQPANCHEGGGDEVIFQEETAPIQL